jgi:hypothetical protein
MVHALLSARRVLTDDGLLLDIHPISRKRAIFCEVSEGRKAVGYLRLSGSHIRYQRAQDALDRVASQGFFRRLGSVTFTFRRCTRSLDDLRRYLTQQWTSVSIDRATAKRISRVLESSSAGMIVIEEVVRMSLLEKQ